MEEIQVVISEIGTKIQRMKSSIQGLKMANHQMGEELTLLTEKLGQREKEAEEYREKYEGVHRQLEENLKERGEKVADKNSQIDELVREIDNCIKRLKA